MSKKGCLVISLDYELMWGCCEWSVPQEYGMSNIVNVPKVIDCMLDLFQRYDVKATFAIVGMIMHKDKKELLENIPQKLPSYENPRCSPYNNHYIENIQDEYIDMYFAPETVKKLNKYPNVEIATHTFCHYYCWEKGQTIEQFEDDLINAIKIANNVGIRFSSIVFPKNMVSDEYLRICKRHGINNYRGNALKFFNEPKSRFESIKNKACRLLDAYLNIGGYTSIPYTQINKNSGVLNVAASRMLRSYSPKLSIFEGLRLSRIKKEMEYAARNGEIYHLWWHPHNFGANMAQNLIFLEKILKCYQSCSKCYGMLSCSMSEVEKIINEK